MINGVSGSIAGFVLGCVFAIPVSCAGWKEGNCRDAAREIVGFAKDNGVKKISVLGFTARGGAEAADADYISEEISVYLAGHKKPVLVERSQLERVLREAKLTFDAGEDGKQALFADLFTIDAVVTGTVFAAGGKLKVLVRLIDLRTGTVLLSSLAEEERLWPPFPKIRETEGQAEVVLPPLPAPGGLHSDGRKASCGMRKLRLYELKADLKSAEPLFWAAKMKEPGFGTPSLGKKAGAEPPDTELPNRFSRLLEAYYRSENAAPPGQDKLAALMTLLEEDDLAAVECGGR